MIAEPRRLRWFVALGVLLLGIVAAAWPIATRTHFVFDDYRYLDAIREADTGEEDALLEATIVENRWDQHWWIPDGTHVRFFRPFVIASYWLDHRLWGTSAAGFVLSNVLLHAACSWLVFVLLRRLLARWRPEESTAWPALAGALLFAVQSCHTEQLWYVAGRTDTLAALAFLGGLVAWTAGRGAFVVGVLFFAMLLAKEYTLLFVPVVVLLERWLPADGWRGWRVLVLRRRNTWFALGFALAAFLALRWWALGPEGSGAKPFPYFYLPSRAGFLPRTAGIALDYATSLVTGRPIATFTAGLDEVVVRHGWPRLIVAALGLVGFLGWSLRTAPGRVGVAMFALLLVPLLPLYSSGRYLYLPTIGLALAFAALLVTRSGGRSRLVAAFAVACIGTQVWQAQESLQFLPRRPDVPTAPEEALALLDTGFFDLSPDAPPIFVADFPMGWLALQFVHDALEVQLGHDVPELVFLSCAPRDPAPGLVLIERRGAGFALARPSGPLYLRDERSDFDQRLVREGETIREAGFDLEVLREANGLATAAEVVPVAPMFQLGVFRPLPEGRGWHTRPVPDPTSTPPRPR